MSSICVFCGSRSGSDPAYEESARRLGETLALAGTTLVYGGGNVGLMGVVANAALRAGGEVIGVMPGALVRREIAHSDLTRLHVVGSMHERKQLMSELSEGFVAMPGGCGTLEEFFEVLTWAQLGEHRKPCGLLNVAGYYDPLLDLLDHMVTRGFLSAEHRAMVLADTEPQSLLDAFESYRPPQTAKWVGKDDT